MTSSKTRWKDHFGASCLTTSGGNQSIEAQLSWPSMIRSAKPASTAALIVRLRSGWPGP
jgi:hypothetical protein